MKLLATTLIILSTAAPDLHTAGVIRPPHLSGDEFLLQFRGIRANNYVNSGTQYGQNYAKGYLAGVVDASQGSLWCAPAHLKPDEADQQVIAAMAQRALETTPAMASIALLKQYIANFPMTGATCSSAPRLSGDQFATWLVGDLKKPGVTRQNQSAEASNRQRYAEGYVGGVIDATHSLSALGKRRYWFAGRWWPGSPRGLRQAENPYRPGSNRTALR